MHIKLIKVVVSAVICVSSMRDRGDFKDTYKDWLSWGKQKSSNHQFKAVQLRANMMATASHCSVLFTAKSLKREV